MGETRRFSIVRRIVLAQSENFSVPAILPLLETLLQSRLPLKIIH